jgi:hypothetical protein
VVGAEGEEVVEGDEREGEVLVAGLELVSLSRSDEEIGGLRDRGLLE